MTENLKWEKYFHERNFPLFSQDVCPSKNSKKIFKSWEKFKRKENETHWGKIYYRADMWVQFSHSTIFSHFHLLSGTRITAAHIWHTPTWLNNDWVNFKSTVLNWNLLAWTKVFFIDIVRAEGLEAKAIRNQFTVFMIPRNLLFMLLNKKSITLRFRGCV